MCLPRQRIWVLSGLRRRLPHRPAPCSIQNASAAVLDRPGKRTEATGPAVCEPGGRITRGCFAPGPGLQFPVQGFRTHRTWTRSRLRQLQIFQKLTAAGRASQDIFLFCRPAFRWNLPAQAALLAAAYPAPQGARVRSALLPQRKKYGGIRQAAVQ